MTEQNKTKVPAELIPAGDYPVVSTDAVMDKQKGKTQEEVNTEAGEKIAALEESVGSGGSVDTRIENAVNTEKARAENVEAQLSNEIDVLQKQDIVPVDSLPSVADADPEKIYRVVGTTSYTDYMVDTMADPTAWKTLATYSFPGIDDTPTAGSENLVKSGGVQNELALGAVYDVSAKNPTAGQNNDGKFESLSALLSDANINTLIPIVVRKGGMSIKFIQSSDNKYVCFRYMLPYGGNTTAENNKFVTPTNWQGVDAEPTAGSENLVKSGGVDTKVQELSNNKGDLRVFSNNGLLIKNGYIGASYGFTPDSSGDYKYILLPVTEGQEITLSCISTSNSYVVMCDSATHYTTSVAVSLGNNNITIPNGIIYLAFQVYWQGSYKFDFYYTDKDKKLINNACAFSTGEFVYTVGIDNTPTTNSNNLVKSGGIIKKINEEIEIAKDDLLIVQPTEQTVNLKSNVTWLEGYYTIKQDGTLTERTSLYKVSDYILLPQNTKTILYTGGTNTSGATDYKQVAIYNDNNECLSVFFQHPAGQGVSFDISELYGATKMRISEYDRLITNNTWDLSVIAEIIQTNQEVFEDFSQSVNESLDGINGQLLNLDNKYYLIDEFVKEISLKPDDQSNFWEEGSNTIDASGNVVPYTSADAYRVSKFIVLPNNTKSLIYKGGVSTSKYHKHVALYDEQENCLATFREGDPQQGVTFDITNYPTATKIRVCEWVSYISNNSWDISAVYTVRQTNKETFAEFINWIDSLNQWKNKRFLALGASNTAIGASTNTAYIQIASQKLKMLPPLMYCGGAHGGKGTRRVSLKYTDGVIDLLGIAATKAESNNAVWSYENLFDMAFDCVLFGGFAGESYDESQVVIDGVTYYGGEELIDLVQLPATRYNNNPHFTYSNGDTLAQHRDSYIGALIFLINELWTRKPTCRVVFANAFIQWNNYSSFERNKNGVKKLCEKLRMPFIDISECVYFNGFTTGTNAEGDDTNPNLYLYDGQHASLAGRQRQANIFTHRLLLLD